MLKQSQVLFIALVGIFLVGIGVDLYTPAMPAMTKALHTDAFHIKNTISIYLLCFAFGQILFGTLSDIFGRKPIILLGIGLFVVASFAAALTTNIYILLLMRALQGLAAASLSVICKAMVVDTRSGRALTNAYAYIAMVYGCGPIIAPFIGGYLFHYLGWRANFYTFAIYSSIVFILTVIFFEETHINRLPFVGQDILASYKKMLIHPIFMDYILCAAIGYCAMVLFNIFGPFLLQQQLHYSAIAFGYTALFIGAAFLIGSTICRVALLKLNGNVILNSAILITLIASISMLVMAYTLPLNIFSIVLPIFFIVVAIGMIIPIVTSRAIKHFPENGGISNAVLGFTLYLAGGITTWLASFLRPTTMIDPAWFYLLLMILQTILIIFIYSRKQTQ